MNVDEDGKKYRPEAADIKTDSLNIQLGCRDIRMVCLDWKADNVDNQKGIKKAR